MAWRSTRRTRAPRPRTARRARRKRRAAPVANARAIDCCSHLMHHCTLPTPVRASGRSPTRSDSLSTISRFHRLRSSCAVRLRHAAGRRRPATRLVVLLDLARSSRALDQRQCRPVVAAASRLDACGSDAAADAVAHLAQCVELVREVSVSLGSACGGHGVARALLIVDGKGGSTTWCVQEPWTRLTDRRWRIRGGRRHLAGTHCPSTAAVEWPECALSGHTGLTAQTFPLPSSRSTSSSARGSRRSSSGPRATWSSTTSAPACRTFSTQAC